MELRKTKRQEARSPRFTTKFAHLLTAFLVFSFLSSPEAFGQETDIAAEAEDTELVQVSPNRPTYANDALFYGPGHLHFETAYAARLYEGPADAIHTLNILTTLGIIDLLEARVGWDVFNVAGGDSAVGDLMLGAKAGFFGGLGHEISLAGIFELLLPTGSEPNSIDEGINLFGGLTATHLLSSFQFDLQAALDSHIFTSEATLQLPISFAATWSPINVLRVYSDLTVGLDLTNLNDSTTSFLGGVGYMIIRQLSIDTTARVGLSREIPDVTISAGLTWLVGDFF